MAVIAKYVGFRIACLLDITLIVILLARTRLMDRSDFPVQGRNSIYLCPLPGVVSHINDIASHNSDRCTICRAIVFYAVAKGLHRSNYRPGVAALSYDCVGSGAKSQTAR